MHPYDKSAIIIEICFSNSHADVSENRLPETKNNFSDYDIITANTLSFPLCPLMFSWFPQTEPRNSTVHIAGASRNAGKAPGLVGEEDAPVDMGKGDPLE